MCCALVLYVVVYLPIYNYTQCGALECSGGDGDSFTERVSSRGGETEYSKDKLNAKLVVVTVDDYDFYHCAVLECVGCLLELLYVDLIMFMPHKSFLNRISVPALLFFGPTPVYFFLTRYFCFYK